MRCRSGLVSALLLSVVSAAAQPAAPPLSMAEAIGRAVNQHPDLAAIEANIAAVAARVPIERGLPPPMVELQVWQWPFNRWKPTDAQWMVMLEQELPGKGKRDLRVTRARAEVAVAGVEVARHHLEMATQAVERYLDLRIARDTQARIAEAEAIVRQGIDAAELRYAAGSGAQQDVLMGVVELARLADERLMAEEAERMAAVQLNSLMHRPPDAPIGPLDPARADAGMAFPAEPDVTARVAGWHPDLAAVERETERAVAERNLGLAERKPDYIVQGGLMAMPSMTDAFTARVGFSWPNAPWARHRVNEMLKSADAAILAATAQRESATVRIRQVVAEQLVAAQSAERRRALLADSVLPALQHALEIARIDYAAGRSPFTPLLELTRRLNEAALDIIRVRADRDRALTTLDVLTGDLTGQPHVESR